MNKHAKIPKHCMKGMDIPVLVADSAVLHVETPDERDLELWAQSEECFKCPLMKICDLNRSLTSVVVNSTFPTRLAVKRGELPLCNDLHYHFGEFGHYNLSVNSSGHCHLRVARHPANSNLPILYSFLAYVCIALFYCGCRYIVRRRRAQNVPGEIQEDPGLQADVSRRSSRLLFLDAFRGLCIVVMIFVNYGGGLYWFFTHSAWNGLTVADLVFPWFVFIMGTAMALSFNSLAVKGVPIHRRLLKVIRRSLILFGLGLLLGAYKVDLSKMRIAGVLQRFAISYGVAGCVRALTAVPVSAVHLIQQQFQQEGTWRRHLAHVLELLVVWPEWLVMTALVVAHSLLTFLLPVPGCPRGYLGPGGLGDGAAFPNCTGGAAGEIDRWFFGVNHIYQHPTCKWMYNTATPFDPEGLLGSLTSILIVFLGLQAGQILLVYESLEARVMRLSALALVWGLVAGVLCDFSQNEGIIPLNKNLWSLSFVFALAAMGNVLLIVLYWLIDVKRWWTGAPFFFVGMNSILIYVGHELLGPYFPFSWSPLPLTHAAHLAENLWATSLWVLIAYYLHYHRFYLAI